MIIFINSESEIFTILKLNAHTYTHTKTSEKKVRSLKFFAAASSLWFPRKKSIIHFLNWTTTIMQRIKQNSAVDGVNHLFVQYPNVDIHYTVRIVGWLVGRLVSPNR